MAYGYAKNPLHLIRSSVKKEALPFPKSLNAMKLFLIECRLQKGLM